MIPSCAPEVKPARLLLQGIGGSDIPEDIPIGGASLDSRRIEPGHLFVALQGATVDGADFIADAVDRGAGMVVFESDREHSYHEREVLCVGVPGLRTQLPRLLHRLYDDRIHGLTLIAVTGTNGKTTCGHLLAQAFNLCGRPAAYIGTLGWGRPDDLVPGDLTTPDIIELYRRLFCCSVEGIDLVCFEVSSHAIAQERIDGLAIATVLLTNISRDHLDYHNTMEEYAAIKHSLLQRSGVDLAVVNADDEQHPALLGKIDRDRLITFGRDEDCDVRLIGFHPRESGMDVTVEVSGRRLVLESRLLGGLNVENLLAVVGVLSGHGLSTDELADCVRDLQPVPGRMELFQGGADLPRVVVDYAHTPDALEKALHSLRPHTPGRLWCIFGCGGDRDRGKRPLMGRIAEAAADEVILTDDNPRSEPAPAIVSDIASGMSRRHRVIHDRLEAITWAISHAASGDTVLVAGKGHETTQTIGELRIPLDDREVVRQVLEQAA